MGLFAKREAVWFAIFFAVSVLAGYQFGGGITIKDQIALFDNILKVSSIVLGVSGVWIGVLKSEVLRSIDDTQGNRSVVKDSMFSRLVRLVLWSTFVVCLSLSVLIWGEPILNAVSTGDGEVVKSIFFGLISLVALFEIYLLVMSLIPLSDVDDEAQAEKKRNERRERDRARRG